MKFNNYWRKYKMMILIHKKNSFKYYAFSIILLIQMLALQNNVIAQSDNKAIERIESLKKIKLLEVLKLDEATADKFLIKYTTYENTIKEKKENLDNTADDLKNSLKSHESNDEIIKKSDKMIQLQEELQKIHLEKLKAMKSLLNEKQYAKYLVFENNFNRELRQNIFKVLKQRGKFQEHGKF